MTTDTTRDAWKSASCLRFCKNDDIQVSRDLPFSGDQPLKPVADRYVQTGRRPVRTNRPLTGTYTIVLESKSIK